VSKTNGTPGYAMPTTKNPEAMGLLGITGEYEGEALVLFQQLPIGIYLMVFVDIWSDGCR